MNRSALFVIPILLTVVLGCRFLQKETVEPKEPPKTVLTETVLRDRLTAKGVTVDNEKTPGKLSPLELRLGFNRSNSSYVLNDESFESLTALRAKLMDIRTDRESSGIFNEGTNDTAMKLTLLAQPSELQSYSSKGIFVEDFEKLVDDMKIEKFNQIELRFSDPDSKLVAKAPVTADEKVAPKVISGGIINGKATNLVKPDYPDAARAVRASGAVNVKVLVDEKGNVIEAEAVSGHPLLKDSAVKAARESKFSPTFLSGTAVRVSGTLVFNFSENR